MARDKDIASMGWTTLKARCVKVLRAPDETAEDRCTPKTTPRRAGQRLRLRLSLELLLNKHSELTIFSKNENAGKMRQRQSSYPILKAISGFGMEKRKMSQQVKKLGNICLTE
jgi:hypothetical protein